MVVDKVLNFGRVAARCCCKAYESVHSYVNPVGYARSVGVRVGIDCRLRSARFGSEPYLITLGDHVSACGVSFITHDGAVWVFRKASPDIELFGPIVIGNNVFLGAGGTVLPGVTIGDNVIVGAAALVVNDIPSNCVAVGFPAKPIGSLEDYFARNSPRFSYTREMSCQDKREYLLNHFGLDSAGVNQDGK